MNKLRGKLTELLDDLAYSDEGVEQVLDAILQALPEENKNLDSIDQHEMGYNAALKDFRTILEQARSKS